MHSPTLARPSPRDEAAGLPATTVADQRLIPYFDQKRASVVASFGVWYSRSLRYIK